MVLLFLAATSALQWTGPRTEEYRGPGYFCGGGYTVHLMKGDRALVLPQSATAGVQGVRLVIATREVNVWSGASAQSGPVVIRYGRTFVTQHNGQQGTEYIVADATGFGLHLTAREFRGFRRDGWFFSRANFGSAAEDHVPCLAAFSN